MFKIHLATETTDSKGETSTTYTGVGGGQGKIIAELHDDDTVQSGTYPVLDATFLDRGTSSSHNDTYFYSTNIERDFTRGTDSTSVNMTTQNGGDVILSVGDGMCFEMELVEVDTYLRLNIVRSESGQSTSYHGQSYTEPCKCRLEILPSQTIFKQIINGVSTTLLTINNTSNSNFKVYFAVPNGMGTSTFKFKNFAIFPI